MDNLPSELRKEHFQIFETLVSAKQLCISTKEGKLKLREAMELLDKHITKEDEMLYPVLRTAAHQNKSLDIMLKIFDEDMMVVSENVKNFVDKYTLESDSMEFIAEFGQMFIMVKDRMTKEENVLFPEFLKLDC